MADKQESALTQQSDCKWVRALDANGNSIRISKEDLAAVVGGLLPLGIANIINGTGSYKLSLTNESQHFNILINTGNGGYGGWFLLDLGYNTKSITCLAGRSYYLQVFYKKNNNGIDYWIYTREATFSKFFIINSGTIPSLIKEIRPDNITEIPITSL